MDIDQIKQKFIERTKKHIDSVNYYAKFFDIQYPDHDSSKLAMLLDGYCYYVVPKQQRTEEQESLLTLATLLHIKNSPHHPEYWTDTNMEGWSRSNFTPNGPIDATNMPQEYIIEMLCDWCATGKEYGNTALQWFDAVNNVRWTFTYEQQQFMENTLIQMENYFAQNS